MADGDTITVYVSVEDSRESGNLPREVQVAAVERANARAQRNYDRADELHKHIIDAGYRFGSDDMCLLIRLDNRC